MWVDMWGRLFFWKLLLKLVVILVVDLIGIVLWCWVLRIWMRCLRCWSWVCMVELLVVGLEWWLLGVGVVVVVGFVVFFG